MQVGYPMQLQYHIYLGCPMLLRSPIWFGSPIHSHGLPWQLSLCRICLQCRRPRFDSWVRKIPWRRERLPTPVLLGFPGGSECKESTRNVGDLDSIPELGRSPGAGPGNPLQYSCLGNPAEEPGGIQSVGSHRVRHNIATEPTRNNVQSRLPLL